MRLIRLLTGGKAYEKILFERPVWQTSLLIVLGFCLTYLSLTSCTNDSMEVEEVLSTDRGPQTQSVDLSAYRNIRYVSFNSGFDKSGNGSKESPWKSISFALNQVTDAADSNRSAILVSEGRYQPEEALIMKSYVDLYGGFDSENWERNIYQYRSILDGKDSHRLVIGSDHAVLDGFVLQDGSVRGNGGAILAKGTSPTVSNNIFIGNKTLKPNNWNPEFWHETANDGGAVACINGCSTDLKNNLFVQNSTEIGRGAAFACDNEATPQSAAAPRVIKNVFVDNITSTGLDTMRSGDGGAISFYGYCKGSIRDNIVSENEASAKNDGGGIFIALWSDPDVTGNIVVGNQSRDDGGGIFIGGQKHHYDTPKDPVPSAERYFIKVSNNVVMGNKNGSPTSGAMRATMMSRGHFENNIFAHNPGGVHTQRAELTFARNVFVDDLLYEDEENQAPGPVVFVENTIAGETDWQAEVTEKDNYHNEPSLTDEGFTLTATNAKFNSDLYRTTIRQENGNYSPASLKDRVVQTDDGKWTVIISNSSRYIQVWGNFEDTEKLEVMPSYSLPKSNFSRNNVE